MRCEKAHSAEEVALGQSSLMTHFKLANSEKWGNGLVNNENGNGADFNEYSVEKGIISEMDLRGGNSITRKAHADAE